MILLDLFLAFLKVGCFAFGGAYAGIMLAREVVMDYGWLTDEALSYMIAVSESTPGPVMVNLATYVGSNQGGLLGAAVATFAVILPAFVIILLIMVALRSLLKNPLFQALLEGLKACVIGLILATGAYMMLKNAFHVDSGFVFDTRAVILTVILSAVMFLPKYLGKKKIGAIAFIGVSAVLGMIVYAI